MMVRSILTLIFVGALLLPGLTGVVLAYERGTYQLNEKAVVLMGEKDYPQAIKLLREAHEALPYNEVVKRNLALSYLGAGQMALKQKKTAEAIDYLASGKEYDDQESRFWLISGWAYLEMHDYAAAEMELNEAWAMSGDEPMVLRLLGRLYYDTDRMYDAVDIWEKALILEPENEFFKDMLAKTRRELEVEQEMDKTYGGQFVITYDGAKELSLGNQILQALEDAYNWVGYRLEYYPKRQIPVIIYTGKDFTSLTGSPGWAAGVYDGKIRLPAGGVGEVDERMRSILYHEYMHVVVREIAGTRVPTWLNEGLAEIAAHEVMPRPAIELPKARKGNRLFSLSQLENSFGQLDSGQVHLAYEQSFSFTRFLVDEFGWFQIKDLLMALGRGQTIAAAIDQTIGIYAVDYKSLEQQWLDLKD